MNVSYEKEVWIKIIIKCNGWMLPFWLAAKIANFGMPPFGYFQ
jgi:hypothetical protein